MANDPWRRFRVHRWVLFGGWLGLLPFAMILGLVGKALGTQAFVPYLVLPYGLAWIANGAVLGHIRCPRCGERFCISHQGLMPVHNAFTKRCLNCGQRAYEPLGTGPVETVPFRFF